jgi:uncharacterized repeat protein (TIGR01451 family)/CSLREA domain-containing protein
MKRLLVLVACAVVVCAAALVPLASPVSAAVDRSFSVNSFSDKVDANIGDNKCLDSTGYCTLRAAVQEANALGGTTSITLATAGTYKLTIAGSKENGSAKGDIDIKSSVKLYAPTGGSGATVTAGTGFSDRIFDIPSGTPDMSVEFEPGLIIKGGKAPSGEDGGGIRSLNAGYLNLNQMTVSNSTARNGGGVYVSGPASSSLNTNVAEFNANTATGIGGGLDVEGDLTATLKYLTAQDNKAGQGGGLATFLSDGSTGSVSTSGAAYLTNNTATDGGGGMAVSRFTGKSFTITGNSAPKGGGIQLIGTTGPSNINGRTYLSNNTASSKGGGIYGSCKTASCGSLGQVSIEDNSADSEGGGMYVNGALIFDRGVIARNTARGGTGGGGVVHIGDSALVMTNVTVADNISRASGSPTSGGVVLMATVVDTFTNDTIAWNTGGSADGVIVTGTGAVLPKLKNTIVADTVTGTTMCNKRLTSQGHNIDSGNTCGFSSNGDMTSTDPGLHEIGDHGGGIDTMSLKTGQISIATDAGDNIGCPVTDARFVGRPQDGDDNTTKTCDIGAFEASFSAMNNDIGMTMSPSTTTPKPGDQVTYTLTFTNGGAVEATNAVVTETLPSQLSIVSCDAGSVSCVIVGNVITMKYASIGFTNLPVIKVVAKVGSSVGKGTVLTNSAVTWADNPDTNHANNVASVVVTVS